MEDRDDLLSEEPEPAAAEKTMAAGADDAAATTAQAAEWKRKEEEATRREVQVRNKNTPKHRPRFLRTKRKTLCKSVFPSVKSALIYKDRVQNMQFTLKWWPVWGNGRRQERRRYRPV